MLLAGQGRAGLQGVGEKLMEKNYFVELNSVNVNEWVEKKNGLSYVSWANAWAEVKKRYPDSTYTIYPNADGWIYHTDGRTCWVATGVTVNGIEHIEYLPVMDYRNASIPADKVTSFDVNKAIQRSLTKAVARHGLGLYIYAGEDLPEDENGTSSGKNIIPPGPICEACGQEIMPFNNGKDKLTGEQFAQMSLTKYGRKLCKHCAAAAKAANDEVSG